MVLYVIISFNYVLHVFHILWSALVWPLFLAFIVKTTLVDFLFLLVSGFYEIKKKYLIQTYSLTYSF